ncbi:MAG TPA: DNA-binding protein WhiA [Firmicutes bacterium]|nr:DNA-binding protein WhiA [Bacillota bacterium]
MSFTHQISKELTMRPGDPQCCRRSELAALVLLRGFLVLRDGQRYLKIAVGYNALARHLFQLIKQAGFNSPQVIKQQVRRLGKVQYMVQVQGREAVDSLLDYLGLYTGEGHPSLSRKAHRDIENRCCQRSFLRGTFLAGGSLSISRSGYHLEINCGYQEDALLIQQFMYKFGVASSVRERNQVHYVYLKHGESIAEFLRVIGAHSALLELENIRVIKSVRNQINRLVNCDTANLDKIVTSSQQQIETIAKVERLIGLSNLSPSLREAAYLRKKHPEASLKELGEMLKPPLGKSGMNHRFRQLARLVRKAPPL